MPPPVEPPSWPQTDCDGGGPGAVSAVPPTAVANGCVAGSSTARAVLPGQPSERPPPAATRLLWPCVAASLNSVLSADTRFGSLAGSHIPQESLMTLAVFA